MFTVLIWPDKRLSLLYCRESMALFPASCLYRRNPLRSHATFLSWNRKQHFAPKHWYSLILICVATHTHNVGICNCSYWKQDRQPTCKRSVVSVWVIVFVVSITYSKCVSVAFVVEHAVRMRRICHLWPLWFYHILLHYLRKGKKFGVMLLDIKCVFWFPVQLLPETFF